MREIKQGTLYGFDLVLKIPNDINLGEKIINENSLEKHIEREKVNAIDKYVNGNLII